MGVTNMNYNQRSMFDYHCLIYNHCEIHEEEDDPSKFLLPEVFHFDEKIDYLKKVQIKNSSNFDFRMWYIMEQLKVSFWLLAFP